jgi:hypothetical protein
MHSDGRRISRIDLRCGTNKLITFFDDFRAEMIKSLPPSEPANASDSDRKHPVYRLFFEFLRMSPSYELARMETFNELDDNSLNKLPIDFEIVRKTYKSVGNLRDITFNKWWETRGQKLFEGDQLPKPHFVNVDFCSTKNKTINSSSSQKLNPSDLLICIPTELKYSDALKHVTELLASKKDLFKQSKSIDDSSSVIKIISDRIHEEKLMKGLYLVQLKADYPNVELWQLGTESRISDDYAAELRPAKNLKSSEDLVSYEKNIMKKLTNRALKNHEAIIENAARGIFPSDKPLKDKFDYEIVRKLMDFYER